MILDARLGAGLHLYNAMIGLIGTDVLLSTAAGDANARTRPMSCISAISAATAPGQRTDDYTSLCWTPTI